MPRHNCVSTVLAPYLLRSEAPLTEEIPDLVRSKCISGTVRSCV